MQSNDKEKSFGRSTRHWKAIAESFRKAQEVDMNTLEKACTSHEDWKTNVLLVSKTINIFKFKK